MLTHANLVAAVGQARATLKLSPRDTLVAIAPFAHVMGFVVTLSNALSAGATARDAAAASRFDALRRAHRAPPRHGPRRGRRR